MPIDCVRGGRIISRYAPTHDRESTLCHRCTEGLSAPDPAPRGPLHCGRDECAFDVVPFACLLAEATNTPIDACPAVA